MKTLIPFIKNVVFLFISFTLLTAGFCSKAVDDEDEAEESIDYEPVPLVDTAKPYVILNVIDPQNPGTVSFPTPADYENSFTPDYQNYAYGKIKLSQSGDTVRSYWLFTPQRQKRAPQLPAWQFCNTSPYDPYNEDGFLIRCTWFKSVLGKDLKVAYPYNLNVQERRSADTYGSAQYWQYNFTSNTYPQNISTTYISAAASSDPYSWMEYSKIENKIASGTFRLLFSCASGGVVKRTEVLGRFGNIPVE